MELKDFPEVNVRIAEDQPEFGTIPALVDKKTNTATFCFQLDQAERERVMDSGEIWFTQCLNALGQMHPISCSTIKEDLING